MKTTLFYGLCLLGLGFAGNAQNVASTPLLTSGGNNAGTTGNESTLYGNEAGKTTGGSYNTFIGHQSGSSIQDGHSNTFVGNLSGTLTKHGRANVFVGRYSGTNNFSGDQNTYVGTGAGSKNQTGFDNVCIGASAGDNSYGYMINSSYNTFLGRNAGFNNSGSNNICIGYNAGSGSYSSNRLFIDNSDDTTPLIWGDFTNDKLVFNGRVGITDEPLSGQTNLFPSVAGGINVSNYKLFVKGGILTEAVRVAIKSPSNWADYVFAEDYKLLPLEEVEQYIEENGHLPNVPSAEEVQHNGIELAEMAKIQQEKIEELTLYLIEQKKEIDALKAQMKALEQKQ